MASGKRPQLLGKIIHAMNQVRSAGQFCVGGRICMPSPHLRIDGVGVLALPLQQFQMQTLKQVATQAPFGKGSKTLIDLEVRDSLQIDASQTVFSNPEWESAVEKLANIVGLGLGIDRGKVKAKFDKLLLYEPGGHFKPHKDSEKAPGMFGTLVLQFPCEYAGGHFHVRHSGLQRTFRMDKENAQEYNYVAFYADCEHEIEPVITGNRITATYCLCWKDDGFPPCAPPMEAANLLAEELQKIDNENVAIILKHTYTQQSISRYGWRALKGFDRSLAGTVQAAMTIAAEQDSTFKMCSFICEVNREVYSGEFSSFEEDFMRISNVHTFDGKHMKPTASLEKLTFFTDFLNYHQGVDEEIPVEPEETWMSDNFMWKRTQEGGHMGNEATPDKYCCFMIALHRDNGDHMEEIKSLESSDGDD